MMVDEYGNHDEISRGSSGAAPAIFEPFLGIQITEITKLLLRFFVSGFKKVQGFVATI